MATYYVDFASGNDATSGTGINIPWQHCPGDSLATGIPLSKSLKSGDNIIFKGGVNYSSSIALLWVGTSGNPITYDGNSAGTFGTGKAILNGGNINTDARRYGFFAVTGQSWLNFNNFECTLFGGHTGVTWDCSTLPTSANGYALSFGNGGTGINITNCYFHNLGDWQNISGMNQSIMEGVGIEFSGTSSFYAVSISGCEFTQIGRAGIQFDMRGNTVRNIRVSNILVHDYVRWGMDANCNSNNCTFQDIIVDGCTFYNLYQYAPNTWSGCSAAFPHFDGIILRVGNTPQYTGQNFGSSGLPVIIRNCNFYNNSATATDAGTAEIFLTTWGGTVLIYNNTFLNTLSQGFGGIYAQDGVASGVGSTFPDYNIYNNSFLDDRNMVTLRTLQKQLALNQGTVRIKNNIFYKTDNGSSYSIECGLDSTGVYSNPTEMDYNIYVTSRPDNTLASMMMPTGTLAQRVFPTFSQLRISGYELHGQQIDPQYLNISYGLGANTSSNNLHISNTSPAIGSGINLSQFFTTDKDGNLRPIGAWSIGAYEGLIKYFRRMARHPKLKGLTLI